MKNNDIKNLRKVISLTWDAVEKRLDSLLRDEENPKIVKHISEFYDNDTVAISVLISKLQESILPKVAMLNGMNIRSAEANQKGYDVLWGGKRIEMKLSAGANSSVFVSSAHQSKDQNDGFWLMKYKLDEKRNRPSHFGMWYTKPFSDMPISKEYYELSRESAQGKTAFASIKIASEEEKHVTPIFGSKRLNGYIKGRPTNRQLKYVAMDLEEI